MQIRKTSQSFPFCGHKPLTWADRELANFERTCYEMLASARSDTGNIIEQMDLPLPPSFKTLFRDIVLFLLSISLVARDAKTFASAADKCCDAVKDELSECETALLRTAREQKEHSDHAEFMHESIRTADTLLGLLLQNAFSIACSDKALTGTRKLDVPFVDLEHTYRRWTSICVSKSGPHVSSTLMDTSTSEQFERLVPKCMRKSASFARNSTPLPQSTQLRKRSSTDHSFSVRAPKRS